MLNGDSIEDVRNFTYLGGGVSKNWDFDEDIKARLWKARKAFVTLRLIWRSINISLKTKPRIYETNVKSVLLYGSETWKQTNKTENDLQVSVNKCLRQIIQVRWPDKITNTGLWVRTNQLLITDTIKRFKWRWAGHTLRRTDSNITKHSLDWNPQVKRRRGRPTTTWRRTIEAEVRAWQLNGQRQRE